MTTTPISKLPITTPFTQQRYAIIDVVWNAAMGADLWQIPGVAV